MQKEDDFVAATDPWALFQTWFGEAERSEPNDANAMSLATVDAQGLPNVRIVLMKGFDERGFVFYTNFESAKGRELLANPKAALCFHWKSLLRQVRVRGPVERVSDDEADAYYRSRPLQSRIGAWASSQSRPLESRAVFEAEIARYAKKFEGEEPGRPPHWSGFRITPLEWEFWHDRPFRLHDRVVFRREQADGPWTRTRLYP